MPQLNIVLRKQTVKSTAPVLLVCAALVGCTSPSGNQTPKKNHATQPAPTPKRVPLPGRFVVALKTGDVKEETFPPFRDPDMSGGFEESFERGKSVKQIFSNASQVRIVRYKPGRYPLGIKVDGIEAPVSWRTQAKSATVMEANRDTATLTFSEDATDVVEVLTGDRVLLRLKVNNKQFVSEAKQGWVVDVRRINDNGQCIDAYGEVFPEN